MKALKTKTKSVSSDHRRHEQSKAVRQCHSYRSTSRQSGDNAQVAASTVRASGIGTRTALAQSIPVRLCRLPPERLTAFLI